MVNLLFLQRISMLHRLRVYPLTSEPPWPMLKRQPHSSGHASVEKLSRFPPSLLSLRSTLLWVSRPIFRHS